MTRKYFEMLAAALKSTNPALTASGELDYETACAAATEQWFKTTRKIADACAQMNVRFDRSRFMRACGAEQPVNA